MKYSIFFMIIVFFSLHGMEVDTSESDMEGDSTINSAVNQAKFLLMREASVPNTRYLLWGDQYYKKENPRPRSGPYIPLIRSTPVIRSTPDIHTLCYDPHNNNNVAAGVADRRVVIWDLSKKNGRLESFFRNLLGYHYLICPPRKYEIDTDVICYNPHQPNQLASGSADKAVWIWNPEDQSGNSRILEGHQGTISAVSWHPQQAHRLASGSRDTTVRVWNLEQPGNPQILRGHQKEISAISWHPHQPSQLASGSDDATVRVWDIEQPDNPIHTLTGHAGGVAVSWHPYEAHQLASGSFGGKVRIWDMRRSGSPIQTLIGDGVYHPPITAVCYHPDGKELISGAVGGGVRTWDLSNMQEIYAWTDSATNEEKEVLQRVCGLINEAHSDERVRFLDEQDSAYVTNLSPKVKELLHKFVREKSWLGEKVEDYKELLSDTLE